MTTKRISAVMAALSAVLALWMSPSALASAKEEQVAAGLFDAINDGRVAKGLDPVQEWGLITRLATRHSERQAERGQISHRGFTKRAARLQSAGSGINGVCENVAFVSGTRSVDEVIRTFYNGWDDSPPHHACLFDEDFPSTWAGVGIERVGSTWYATYIAAQDSSPAQP